MMLMPRAVAAHGGPNHHARGADALIQVGPSGWSGDSSSSDPVNGWGDDQWQLTPTALTQVSVTVTDCCIVGDNYAIYIDGHLIGTTPPEPLNGPTFSSGTASAVVAPGKHLITIQDVGGVQYYSQEPAMFPAGYSVTIALQPTTIDHPVIFVHGIGESAAAVGKSDFAPIYGAIAALTGNPPITFSYVDDRDPTSCSVTPCDSQSPVLDNARQLAKTVNDAYSKANRKVALIGYSMGAAIIRTLLAGCPITEDATCKQAVGEIDDVFFIEGVQQGSFTMQVLEGLGSWAGQIIIGNPSAPLGIALDWIAENKIAPALGLDTGEPAEADLAPVSDNVLLHDAQDPPRGIRYFNFYGDIQLSVSTGLFSVQATSAAYSIGDGVILPGTDSPTDAPASGGSRVCPQCTTRGGYEASQLGDGTTYTEWALTDPVRVRADEIAACIPTLQKILNEACAPELLAAPELHTNIARADSLAGPHAIRVSDTTGQAQTMTIPDEIVAQVELGDGVIL